MRRLPMPVPGPEDVLIRIRAVGVCGSDVSYFRNGRTGVGAIRFPHILGHECAGVVEAAGSRVRTLKAGDPVCIEPGYFCGKCPQCTQGNYNLCPRHVVHGLRRSARLRRGRAGGIQFASGASDFQTS